MTARGNERRAILEDDGDQMTQLYEYLYQRSMYAAFYRYRYEDLPPARATAGKLAPLVRTVDLARVERSNARGEKAIGRVAVEVQDQFSPRTRVSIRDGRGFLNDRITYPGTEAEGLLMNMRMVNAVFKDRNRPDFDLEANTDEFIDRIPEYVARSSGGRQ